MAQPKSIDSLKKMLGKSSGTARVDQLNAYAYAVLSYDLQQAHALIAESQSLSKKINYKKGELEGLLYSGIIESNRGNDSLGISILKKGLAMCRQLNDRLVKARFLSRLGWIEHFENADTAAIHLTMAYQILKDSASPIDLSYLYFAKSQLYRLRNDTANQFNFLNRCWRIRKKIGDNYLLVQPGLEFSYYFEKKSDYKKALSFLDSIQVGLGTDTINNEAISSIRRERGIIFANMGNHLKALDLFSQAKIFYEQNTSYWDWADLFFQVGNVQSDLANYETSLKYYQQAFHIAEQKRFTNLITPIYFRMAWVYYQMGQNLISESYCKKTLALATQRHQELDEASALNLLGLLALQLDQNQKAITFFNQALALRKKNNNPIRVASTLANLGIVLQKLKDFKTAETYFLQSLAIDKQAGHAYGVSETYLNLSELYLQIKDLIKADGSLKEAEKLAKKINARDLLSEIYKRRRDYWLARSDYRQSLAYSIRFENIRDSIRNENLANRILTLRHDFELDQKENEIKILNQESKINQSKLEFQKLEITRQRTIITISIIFSVGIAVFAFVIYIYFKKVKQLNKEISEQNEEINVQSEELRAANASLTKLNREVSEQKEEIQAQAEELMESNRAIAQINEVLEEKVKARTSELKDAYQELDTFFYRSSHDFRRPLTTFMGLAEVAKVMIKEQSALELFEKVNLTAHSLDKMLMKLQSVSLIGSADLVHAEVFFENIFQSEINEFQSGLIARRIEVVTKVELQNRFYSYPSLIKVIIQNLLENSISFSAEEKTKIFLSAKENKSMIEICVADNGQGIDPAFISRVFEMYFRANERSTGNGLGLYIVKKAVDKLKGEIQITSEIAKGTEVRISLPK